MIYQEKRNHASYQYLCSAHLWERCWAGNQQQSLWQMTHLQAEPCRGKLALVRSVASLFWAVPALEVDHNSVYPHPGTTPWGVAQWARPVVTTSYSCWVFTRCLSNSAASRKRDFSWVTNNQVTTRNHMSQGTPLRHCKIANVKRKTGQHLLCMRFIFLWRPPGWTVPAVWPKQTQTQQNETTRCKSQVTLGETQSVYLEANALSMISRPIQGILCSKQRCTVWPLFRKQHMLAQ